MILSKFEEIIALIEKTKQSYNTVIISEQRGYKGKLLEMRKDIMQLKRLLTPAKDEINQYIKK